MRKPTGFSLIELLIVVAIILIIAAIAIPGMLRARMAANESSAVSCLKTINTAQIGYATQYPDVGFADQLTKLAIPGPGTPLGPNAAGFLDWVLGCTAQPCPKSGYEFAISNAVGGPVIGTYKITATPLHYGLTGNRGFCLDQTNTLTYDPNGAANCTQPVR